MRLTGQKTVSAADAEFPGALAASAPADNIKSGKHELAYVRRKACATGGSFVPSKCKGLQTCRGNVGRHTLTLDAL
eukprot:1717795-Amphidinium_carterae.1